MIIESQWFFYFCRAILNIFSSYFYPNYSTSEGNLVLSKIDVFSRVKRKYNCGLGRMTPNISHYYPGHSAVNYCTDNNDFVNGCKLNIILFKLDRHYRQPPFQVG